ncbi:MAG: aldehyde ferredoxin oxidoreductase N-terminal domain-containing protein [Chloroflexota bacterium]
MEMNGWAGKILYVDLSSGQSHAEPLNMDWAQLYIGGHGLAARLGYDLIKPGLDPLAPEAPIILACGPLVGTLTPGGTKTSLLIKSVQCGFAAPGAVGSALGPNIKSAGYDALVITGASEEPVNIEIVDDKVRVLDASRFWGKKDIYETTDDLWAEYGNNTSVLTIGPAGEKMIPISLALADRLSHLGKDGLAAVMGSKKLKAVVVRGTKGVGVADKPRFLKVLNQYLQTLRNFPRYGEWKQYGLLSFLEQYVDTGQMMIGENWRRAMSPEEFKNFSRPLQDKHRLRSVACPGCPVGDKMVGTVPEGKYCGLETGISTIIIITITWVSRFLMGDPEAADFAHAYKLHDICNRAGIEEIQASGIMAWLVDLYNHGVITKDDMDGIEPKYDFKTAMLLLEKTINQEGIGATIAKGWNGAIKDIGRGSEKYAMIQKGLDYEFDPRAAFGSEGFSQCVRSRGGSPPIEAMAMTMRDGEVSPTNIQKWVSRRGIIPKEEQDHIFVGPPSGFHVGRYTKWIEEWYQAMNCLGLCVRPFVGMFMYEPFLPEFFTSVTGQAMSMRDFLRLGERAWNMVKLLNVREGFTRQDDQMPDRAFDETLYYGSLKAPKEFKFSDYVRSHQITRDEWAWLLDGYYDERGWDLERGWPTRARLAELGMKDMADDMVRQGYKLKAKTEPITRPDLWASYVAPVAATPPTDDGGGEEKGGG